MAGRPAATLLGLPVAGSYHTELAAYAQLRSGDPRVALAVQLALGAFYGRCGVVLSPSAAADAALAELGIAAGADRALGPRRRHRALLAARRAPGRFPADRVTVLYAGRLTREKGSDLLADAFLAARARDPRLHLVLAGGGPEEARLRARLGRAATFLGWLDGDALAAAYASADLFLFCSQTDTFGQVVLEAQASGLPVVAVAAGGPAELIADGRSGLLCAPRAGGARGRGGGPRRLAGDARAAGARRPRRGGGAHLGGGARTARRGLAPRARRPRGGGAAGGMTTQRRIAVAIHDVEPTTYERCALIRDWLADHGVDRVTLLVIPAPHLHPFFHHRDLTAWLLDCRDHGDAIAQHGLQHRPAEFSGLSADDTAASIAAGRRMLSLAGVEPRGFVAPAYDYTPVLRRVLTADFDWWATLTRLVGRERAAVAPAVSLRRSPLALRDRGARRGRAAAARRPSRGSRPPAPRARAGIGPAPRGVAAPPSRTTTSQAWRLPVRVGRDGMKLLVLTPEPVDADLLRETLGDEVEGAEVLVVSPATNESKLAFWVSDPDEAIAEADRAQEETVERLEEDGVDAAGDTGESEPAVALQDALATFPADRIVVFSHPTASATTARTRAWRTPRSASGSPSRTP